MASGTVKWFNSENGFGFIAQDGSGPHVFATYSNIQGNGYSELVEGEKVTFDITQGQKGPPAETSSAADGPPPARRAVRAVVPATRGGAARWLAGLITQRASPNYADDTTGGAELGL